jgi:hypothetical protein
MSTAQNQFVDLTRRGQDAALAAIGTWADTARAYASGLTSPERSTAGAREAVNTAYDFAEQLVKTQREFATSLVAAGTEAGQLARAATEQTTEMTVAAVRQMADGITRAAGGSGTRSSSSA